MPTDPTIGADRRIRTADLHFTKVLLYQLSYIGIEKCEVMSCLSRTNPERNSLQSDYGASRFGMGS
jgi:hypothetical protein